MGTGCSHEDSDIITRMDNNDLTDLELTFRQWALKKAPSLGIKNSQKSQVQVKWDRVRFSAPENISWSRETNVPNPPNTTIYSSTFANRMKSEVEHTLRMERTTTASLKTSITTGYTTSMNLGLTLTLPEQVASATFGYGRNITVNKTEENTVEQIQTWSVDTKVVVPPMSFTKAKVEIKERRWKGIFNAQVRMKGVAIVNFYDQNTPGSLLGTVECPVEEVLPNMRTIQNLMFTREVIFPVQGKCDFQFGVEQVVSVEKDKQEEEEQEVEDTPEEQEENSYYLFS